MYGNNPKILCPTVEDSSNETNNKEMVNVPALDTIVVYNTYWNIIIFA